jgi:hypothetical protein
LSEYEARFNDFFTPKGFEVVTNRKANLHDLRQALLFSNASAVFWVSHASLAQCSITEMGTPPLIVDFLGFDVSSAMREFSPSVRFFGIVGCNSNDAIQRLEAQYKIAKNYPDLKILGTSSSIEINEGIDFFTRESLSYLSLPLPVMHSQQEGHSEGLIQIDVVRRIPAHLLSKSEPIFLPAVSLEIGTRTLVTFPPIIDPKMVQNATVELPKSLLETGKGRISSFYVNAGNMSAFATTPISLGIFEFHWSLEAYKHGTWLPRLRSNGALAGQSKNSYEFR